MNKALYSMTGFGTTEKAVNEQSYKIEIKTLNHRYLDIKLRLPRELQPLEHLVRTTAQSQLSRGSVEIKIENTTQSESTTNQISIDYKLAEQYLTALKNIAQKLNVEANVSAREIANYPDVIRRAQNEMSLDETWKLFEPVLLDAFHKLKSMREHEGKNLKLLFEKTLNELKQTLGTIRKKREAAMSQYKSKIGEKIKLIYESYPLSSMQNQQALIESRIAQELAMLLDKIDIEEELARFEGHLNHFKKVMDEGGPVGRKLDFILQELNREINTLGNKAQDFTISEDVVGVKVKLEQMREQVMNLE